MKEYRSKEIYGDFYENEGKPLIIVIGGSRPGLPAPLNEKLLDYLKYNYNVLLLAYYGVGQLIKSLEVVPMEYFIGAINFIKEQYKIVDDQVVIIGQSKGAEATLLLSNYMQSAITIACVGGCYVFQGLPDDRFSLGKVQPKSSWTFNNKELPYIKYYVDEAVLKAARNNNFCTCHEKSIEKNFNKEALINVDSYKGKILFLSAENDVYWPSKKMSNLLIENSKNKNSMHHITLDLEGHYFLNYDESVNEIIKYLDENKI